MNPTEQYSEYLSHNNMDLEVLGESFDDPIKKSDNQKFYSKVTIINCEFGQPIPNKDGSQNIHYSLKRNDREELIEAVRDVKNNIEKYL